MISRNKWIFLLLLFFLLHLTLQGCHSGQPLPVLPPLEVSQQFDAKIEKKQLYDDYVVLIDNSKSIRGQQQVILREAVKVLADIAMRNDRISIVTFGEGAKLLLTKDIKEENDRAIIRDAVRKIDFSGNKSDMTAGFVVLRDKEKELFRQGKATQNIIILSDGLLESSVRKPGAAIDELKEIATRNLNFCKYFPIGLGNTTINKPIAKGRSETGMTLMRSLTGRGGNFFHAESFNQVYGAMLQIFRQTKGLVYADATSGRFIADEAIDRVMIVVPKFDAAKNRLAKSDEISFTAPNIDSRIDATSGKAPYGVDNPTRISWNSSYESFDIISIEKPEPGEWRVNAPAKAMKGVLQLVIDHTRIFQEPFLRYYADQDILVSVAVYDCRTRQYIDKAMDVTFFLRKGENDANPFTVNLTPKRGRYILHTTELEHFSLVPGQDYEYRYTITGKKDFIYLRETEWKALHVYEPLLVFTGKLSGRHQEIKNFIPNLSFWKYPLTPTITIDRGRDDFKALFNIAAPQVLGEIWWINPKTGAHEVFDTLQLNTRQSKESISYENTVGLPPGAYAIVYSARGTDKDGRSTEIRLRPRTISVIDYGCKLSIVCFVLLLIILCLIRRRIRLRLKGRVTMTKERQKENQKWRFEDEESATLPKNRGTVLVPQAMPNTILFSDGPHFKLYKSIPFVCFGRPIYWVEAINTDLKLELFDEVVIGAGMKKRINRTCEFVCIINQCRFTVELSLK